jgi:hypothetical protein
MHSRYSRRDDVENAQKGEVNGVKAVWGKAQSYETSSPNEYEELFPFPPSDLQSTLWRTMLELFDAESIEMRISVH